MVLTPDIFPHKMAESKEHLKETMNSQIRDKAFHRQSHQILNKIFPHNVFVTEDDKCHSTLHSSDGALHHLCEVLSLWIPVNCSNFT